MFYLCYALFWVILFVFPLSFGDPVYEEALYYGDLFQKLSLFLCIITFVCSQSTRKGSCLLLMSFYGLYSLGASIFDAAGVSVLYIIELVVCFIGAVYVLFHPEYSTPKTINVENILLAFYKGEKGSLIMRVFAMFGFPVKSVCILAGDKALYLKANKPTFEFGNSAKIHKKSREYVIVDTGVAHTGKFLYEMKKHSKIVATKGVFRIRCIEAVSDLLGMIGSKYKPGSYIPSLYLRQVIK